MVQTKEGKMTIMEAVADLKAELEAGTEVSKAVAWASKEYGFREDVLRVRFQKAFGRTVEEQSETKIVARDLVAEATEVARNYASKCQLPDWQHRALGQTFYFDNEKFVFAAFLAGVWGLKAVKVETGHLMQLRGRKTVEAIVSKLAA
jgi:hypothetical protein